MGVPFFIFNNINSKEKGILVNNLPPISKAERKYEELEIPGRNGKLYIDENCYNTFTYAITCTLMPDSNIREISKWLNGTGKLVLCTELDKIYDVLIKDQIDYEQTYRICNQFEVNFEVQPVAKSVLEKEINLNEESSLIIKESTYQIKPYIKVVGSGNITLTINNNSINLKNIEDYIELDCELEEAFKDNENCNSKVECEDFPILFPGENIISWTGNISNLYIKYKEAFI